MPGTDREIHSWPVWNNGYVAKFTKGCHCFCTDCNYTVSITAIDSGYYVLTGKRSDTVERLKTGEVYDAVLGNSVVCYEYEVKDKDADLRVRMNVFSGEPDIFVAENKNGSLPNYL
jgi:hypothetical protein